MVKVRPYSNYVKLDGELNQMPEQLLKEVIELCQEQAREELEALGQKDKLPDLFWRFEQQYNGSVNGKQVSAPVWFIASKPQILVAWKLVE